MTGPAVVGGTLAATLGTWGGSPSSYLRQWYADGDALPGETGPTLLVTGDQQGEQLRHGVVATNAAGDSDEAMSDPVGPVAPTDSLLWDDDTSLLWDDDTSLLWSDDL